MEEQRKIEERTLIAEKALDWFDGTVTVQKIFRKVNERI